MEKLLVLASCVCIGLVVGILYIRLSERGASRLDGNARFNSVRELLRSKLLAGGKHECSAYHVTENGVWLRVDAECFYAALFAGVHDFWELVEVYGGEANRLAEPVEKMEFRNGEGCLTCIRCNCGETYLDTIFPSDLPYPYLCSRVTADEFKNAIIQRKAEAAERAEGNDAVEDGLVSHGANSIKNV